jgi:DNA-binding NarL/FixJ family response regulator
MSGADATGEKRLRVIVVDDHDVVQWGFRLLLTQQPWVERVLAARSSADALALTRRYEPHVALVDLFVGGESGPEICERLRRTAPPPRVLLISGAGRISQATARAAGASGFVPKDWPATEIVAAVRAVGNGESVFAAEQPLQGPPLSPREREVLEHIAGGETNREIAHELHLSPHTVKEHTSSLYQKLGVRNRAEAARRAQELGLVGGTGQLVE